MALVFHKTREAITSVAIKQQHATGEVNWADFLTKAVDNIKFIACTWTLMVPCHKAMNS